ncbi:MAG: hypothetical protein ACTING_03840 [Leuconostoc mesenteroides]
MTEPVAYMWKTERGTIIGFTPKDNSHSGGQLGIPLYTAEQLHPRVKMTQAEFETIKIIKQKNNLLSDALNSTAFFGDEKQQSEQQIEFANLFINLDLDNPEETIEIVPDKKWFVRSKESEINGYGWLSIIDKYQTPIYQYSHDKPLSMFVRFDTKEEAELWTNPLTEAVQLPVEGE